MRLLDQLLLLLLCGSPELLQFAARQGHLDAVRALIEAGADVNLTGADNTSPLLIAIVAAPPVITKRK